MSATDVAHVCECYRHSSCLSAAAVTHVYDFEFNLGHGYVMLIIYVALALNEYF